MKNTQIIVLGSKGMLGQMVTKYFENENYSLIRFDDKFTNESINQYTNELNKFEDSFVINCIGRIKQKSDNSEELFTSNTILPLSLARSLKSTHILVHPSTDCVFSGNTISPYNSFDIHNATDLYGISKSLGETALSTRANTIIIRVSIIGPDINSNKGLLSWFLSNPPKSTLNGYTNHFWNGITTLEWCKLLHSFIKDENLLQQIIKQRIIQVGTSRVYNKYEMLQIFNTTFHKDFTILPTDTERIDRSLVPSITAKSLEKQIDELLNVLK